MLLLAYSVRSLLARKTTSLLTAVGLGLVVFVFAAVLMLAHGIERTLGRAGADDVAIVLRDGSDAEMSSSIEVVSVGLITARPEVRTLPDGRPDAVAEVVGVVALEKLGADGVSNVLVRGVDARSLEFRPSARIVEGRAARPGTDEAVVGRAIRGRFAGVDLGQSFELRKNRRVRIVGVLSDGGSAYESEVWADIDGVRAAFGREGLVCSVRVRLQSEGRFETLARALDTDRQLAVMVRRETRFYEEQSQGMAKFIKALGLLVAVFFSLGAMIGAMITMHAAVARRGREIGTLRALGFSRLRILTAFLVESVVLSVGGGVLGAGAALGLRFARFSIVNFTSWSEVVFEFTPTPKILVVSLVFAAVMGLLGGLFPAVRAARSNVLEALRA
ncbi:MAG: ABC transporter permease [Deltaproteobacteria bacterium]|nr:ABC transporter permease [Deltaproteobacteria bacterium]